MLIELPQGRPVIGINTFVAPTAQIMGDVTIGKNSSVWFNTVLRGDVMPIRIGDESNIQDGSILHGTHLKCGVTMGNRVTVGHGVILHGCDIGDRVLIGMGSVIMDMARISSGSFVAAGSLVTEGKEFPPDVLIVGRPAVVKRPLTDEERAFLDKSADNYLLYKSWYKDMKVLA